MIYGGDGLGVLALVSTGAATELDGWMKSEALLSCIEFEKERKYNEGKKRMVMKELMLYWCT